MGSRGSHVALGPAQRALALDLVYGAALVAAMVFDELRPATLTIARPLVTALVVDRSGWLGLPEQPLSPARSGADALVLAARC